MSSRAWLVDSIRHMQVSHLRCQQRLFKSVQNHSNNKDEGATVTHNKRTETKQEFGIASTYMRAALQLILERPGCIALHL